MKLTNCEDKAIRNMENRLKNYKCEGQLTLFDCGLERSPEKEKEEDLEEDMLIY